MAVPTYKHIQEHLHKNMGITVKTCWIAHVKELMGLPMRRAPNRQATGRKHPCPDHLREPIMRCIIELSG